MQSTFKDVIVRNNNNFFRFLESYLEQKNSLNSSKTLIKICIVNLDLNLYKNAQLTLQSFSAARQVLDNWLKDITNEVTTDKSLDLLNIEAIFNLEFEINLIITKVAKQKLDELIFKIFKILNISSQSEEDLFHKFKMISLDFDINFDKPEAIVKKLNYVYYNLFNDQHNYHIKCDQDYIKQNTELNAKYQKINLLKKSIINNQLRFAFQPIVNCKNGIINHYECLLRLTNDDTLSSAGPIIPIAEEFGIISIIDDLVIDMLIEELENSQDIIFAVNISNLGISNDYLLAKINKYFANSDYSSRVIIEITETSVHENFSKTKNFISNLHKLGCKVAIDDFGAGYTSFKQLKTLPIDYIKIDGGFIKDVLDNFDNQFFVKTLVKIAEELGTQTIAEFVENGEIAKFLLDINVDYMQGNYFSPPFINRKWKTVNK